MRFHGDEKTPEQIFIIPFRDGDNIKYFVVGGVCEGDRRAMRCDMSWVMMPMAWERLKKLMKWEYKKRYGRLPSGEELKKVKSELYNIRDD